MVENHTASGNAPLQVTAQTGGRVMVVDDEEKSRRLLADLLAAEGYTVQAAADGMEALQLAHGFKPETILMDVMMPKLDGVEACRRLKADPATASIPVLMVTALSERADRLKGIQAGANDFLAKPIDAEELRLRVKNAVHAKHLYDKVQDDFARLRELETLRDNLTNMIVHDMRSPLNVMNMSYEIIATTPKNLSPTQKALMAAGRDACQKLIEMVTSLLDVSRMEAGKMPLNLVLCDIREIARAAVDSVAVLAREDALTLRVTGNSAGGVVDRDITHRIFVNLLGNAIKFSPKGGTIGIEISSAGETVRVAVTDQGPGIPPEYHRRIFEKFGQVESREENKKYSTGLGLAFCKLAVEAHGGEIGVASQAGRGSTFTFSIPKGT
jgi:signal transduction histidine kinase